MGPVTPEGLSTKNAKLSAQCDKANPQISQITQIGKDISQSAPADRPVLVCPGLFESA